MRGILGETCITLSGECRNLRAKSKISVADRGLIMMARRSWAPWADGGLDIGCLPSEFALGEMYPRTMFFLGFLIFEACLLLAMVFHIFTRSRRTAGTCCKVNAGIQPSKRGAESGSIRHGHWASSATSNAETAAFVK